MSLARKSYFGIVVVFLTISLQTSADNVAIIGGIDLTGAPPYSALVSSSDALTPLVLGDPMTVTGIIESVSMNSSGISLIGGQAPDSTSGFTSAYAALVSPSGAITPLTLPDLLVMHGIIYGVGINNSGNGIIGGRDTTGPIYAALVPASGSPLVTLTFPAEVAAGGIINSVAINASGNSLIGGQAYFDAQPAYAASVSPSGVMSPLTLTGGIATNGHISAVSINSSGNGIIGGADLTGSQPAYAALVSTSGTVTPLTLTGGGIATSGQILSVAINDSESGLIGGQDKTGSQPAYAAIVSSSGTVTPLILAGGVSTNGIINSVAINSDGNGIIGGQDLTNSQPAYAALISSSGTVTPLALGSDMASNGVILSVAINSDGNGIIGGQDFTGSGPAYAALFTSSGTVIPLTFTGGMATNGWINGVAWMESAPPSPLPIFKIPTGSLSGNNFIFANYINEFSPDDAFYFIPAALDGTLSVALQSAAPTRNGISIYTASNNLFFLTTSFANYVRNKQNCLIFNEEDCYCDDLEDPMDCQDKPLSIWFEVVGALAHQKSQHQTVGFDPSTSGALLACDCLIAPQWQVGGGISYLFTHIHEKQNQGRSNINQEEAFIYGSWDNQQFYLDILVMGGAVQIDQTRYTTMTGFAFSSSSHPHAWQLLPHLELGYQSSINTFSLNPFVMVDWANAWQESYKETGNSPFNAAQKSHYGSLLRSEAGLRFNEIFSFNLGHLRLQEKISYVNLQSFNAGKVSAFLLGSPGSFTLETLSSPQSLGVAQLAMSFDPMSDPYPRTTLLYQGEFGQKYQSHQLNIEFAWHF